LPIIHFPPRRMLMPTPAIDHPKPTKGYPTEPLAKRVAAVQERARNEGFVSCDADDKPMMDEAWGEDS
jgi:hypothetical protein